MLTKGEKANSTLAREERNSASVRSLCVALRSMQNGGPVPKDLVDALESQAALARFSNAKLGILGMSLNTHRRAAVRALGSNGWAVIDALRRQLKRDFSFEAAATNGNRSLTQRLIGLQGKVREMRRAFDVQASERYELLAAYMELLDIATMAARRDEQIKNRLDRHKAAFAKQGRLHLVRGNR
ncbi:hypothetical protein PSO31014_02433 [Pandoraea soli]|uniref:Uncharacterized protein n=2 Tax=Burkholderiaceae TaxID=119060 RepID=A0ABY6VZI6_9BURK|nr:hypothetical protein PSO31014_02433 [Pandoraea soli]